jgi:hypothetical protein
MKAKEALVGSFKMLKEKPKFVLPMIVLTILGVGIVGVSIVRLTLVTEEAVTPQKWYLLGSMFFVLMILISVVSGYIYYESGTLKQR